MYYTVIYEILCLSQRLNKANEEIVDILLSKGQVRLAYTQEKMNSQFRVDENSHEQCFAAQNVQCCQQQQYFSVLLPLIAGASSGSTIVENIEQYGQEPVVLQSFFAAYRFVGCTTIS